MDKKEKLLTLFILGGVGFLVWRNAQANVAPALVDLSYTGGQAPAGTLDESADLSTISSLPATIMDVVDKMTSGYTKGERNNNPGNLEGGGNWLGMTGKSGSYLIFSTPFYGMRALCIDLKNKFNRGLNTVSRIINAYAPPFENDTAAYISDVANTLGVSPDTPLNLNDPTQLANFAQAIIKHENGRVIYAAADIQTAANTALGVG